MAYTSRIKYETIRSIDSSTFTGSYQALGTPLINPAAIIRIVNQSGVNVTLSTDGVNDMDIVPTKDEVTYEYTANTPFSNPGGEYEPAETQYLIKGSASTGLVYLIAQYIVHG